MEFTLLPEKKEHETIIVLDFGSQYTQLIARRVREAGVYCEILPFNAPAELICSKKPAGLILSGGPASVFAGLPSEMDVWMSHGDHVTVAPPGFTITAQTPDALNAFEDLSKRIYGLQFHPEVAHTPLGSQVLRNFLMRVCGCSGNWSPLAVIKEQVEQIQELVGGQEKVICGISGGVDSSVAAAIVNRALGKRQVCIFINNGLLREGEFELVSSLLKQSMKLNLLAVRAESLFLKALKGVIDPELKRKAIGRTFIEIFEQKARELGDVRFLVQGTLYPDVIESVSVRGPSAVIKSHHNVGGLPENMNLRLIEPLRELFKDEVRLIGSELGVPDKILKRHPFPGPGLAVRVIGEVTEENVSLLQAADMIIDEELRLADLYNSVWQAFPVLLPISTVGVMG
ncbi:MAG: glutamine-hydrolyzing GMP synthase, partial [Acidobacteria bacterium]